MNGFGKKTKKSIPNHYANLFQLIKGDIGDSATILNANGESLKESIDLFNESIKDLKDKIKDLKIKRNGPVDKISGKKKRFLRSIKKLYINLREQRIEAIEVDNIIENLQKDGGFSYKSALVLSVIDNQVYDILVTTDGMHRIIMAIFCGVQELAVVDHEEILPGTPQEQIEKIEHDLFESANARSAKIDTTTRKCSNKKSGNMSPKERKMDTMFSDARVKICVGVGSGAFGIYRSKTKLIYGAGFEEWWKLLGVSTSKYYIGPDNFSDIRDILVEVKTGKRCIDVAIAYLLHTFNDKQTRQFINYLRSNSFKTIDSEYWDSGVQHGNGVETSIFRIISHLNEWYRNLSNQNLIYLDTVDFLMKMNPETKCFVTNSIHREIDIKSTDDILGEFFPIGNPKKANDQDFDDIEETLNADSTTV